MAAGASSSSGQASRVLRRRGPSPVPASRWRSSSARAAGERRGHQSAWERGPRPPHAWARASGVGAGGRDPSAAFLRPPRPAARRGRSRRDLGHVGPCLALHRTDLHAVLIDGARDVPIRMAVDVSRTQRAQRHPHVEFGDGSAREYDLVVGADGIHSTVRRLAFGSDATARPVGQVGWRFVAPRPPEITTWTVMLGHRTASSCFRSDTAACTATATWSRASPRKATTISNGCSPVSRSPCPASSTPSRTGSSCIARRSRRSP